MKRIKRLMDLGFNPVMGFLGGLVLGSIVFYVNRKHGFDAAFIASLKQFGYTFFFGGIVVRIGQRLAAEIKPRTKALILGSMVPTIIAIGVTFLVHSLKATPEPVMSTLPTAVSAPISFSIIAWFARRKAEKKANIAQSLNGD